MIGHLVDCADVLKNQFGCSTLRAIAPEHVRSEENKKNNCAKEYNVDEKEHARRMVRNNKRDSDEVANSRNTSSDRK